MLMLRAELCDDKRIERSSKKNLEQEVKRESRRITPIIKNQNKPKASTLSMKEFSLIARNLDHLISRVVKMCA